MNKYLKYKDKYLNLIEREKQDAGFFSTRPITVNSGKIEVNLEGKKLTLNDYLLEIMKKKPFELVADNSLYGIILKIQITDLPKHFIFLESSTDSILFKFVILSNEEEYWSIYPRKRTETYDNFKKEVKIQKDIWIKSTERGYSLCPAIIGAYIYHNEIDQNIHLDKFRNDLSDYNLYINYMKEYLRKNKDSSLGIIVMEVAEGYNTVKTFMYKTEYEQASTLAIFGLQYLHSLGYCHGDFHRSNVLANVNKPSGLITDKNGRIFIIDFGRTIEDSTLKTKIFNPINEFKCYKNPDHDAYQWLKGIHLEQLRSANEFFIALQSKIKKKIEDYISEYPTFSLIGNIIEVPPKIGELPITKKIVVIPKKVSTPSKNTLTLEKLRQDKPNDIVCITFMNKFYKELSKDPNEPSKEYLVKTLRNIGIVDLFGTNAIYEHDLDFIQNCFQVKKGYSNKIIRMKYWEIVDYIQQLDLEIGEPLII
jgi:serine/threonine protein kinase